MTMPKDPVINIRRLYQVKQLCGKGCIEFAVSVFLRIVKERGQMVSYNDRFLIRSNTQRPREKRATIFMELIVGIDCEFLFRCS